MDEPFLLVVAQRMDADAGGSGRFRDRHGEKPRSNGLGGELLGRRLRDLPGKPDLLEQEDEPAARVELELAQAVERARRERVVVVVPRLAEGEERQPPDVPRLVRRAQPARAEEVA